MSIWRISRRLRLSQNFVKNWKFSWPRYLAKFWDFDQVFKTFISALLVDCNSQNGILECSLVDLKDFWKFEVESKFCEKLKIFMTAVIGEISDFDQLFKTFILALWMNCKSQNGILECSYIDLKDFWKYEVELKFCEELKIFMTAVLSEITDFDQVFKTFISDLWMNCKSQNGILECSLVHLKDFWKFEVESKFCEKLKIFMTAVLSEISDFDQFFKIFISHLWMNCTSQNGILECSYVDLKDFWKFEVESKFCEKLKIFMTAVLSEISDFDQLFKNIILALLVDCKSQNGILEYSLVHLNDFWKFEVESKFCEKLKIFMTAVLSEISDFDQLFKTLISALWMNCNSENGILECSVVHLNDFWKFEVESKFCEKLKIFMTAVLSEISDFDQVFKTFISDLWMNCKFQNGNLECSLVHLKDFWKFEVESKFCEKLKIFMSAVLSEISDFDQLFKTFISDLWMNCKSKNGNLECFYVDLKDFWKFEVESKFCEKLKIFMTAVLSEISDFDQLFKTFISDLWMNCKSQNGILECSLVHLKDFRKFEVESKFCEKIENFHDRGP